ncbi:hypothetical protein FIBSPDRAFT_850571 [Athelia psychrophila]|uniref:ChrR-like cupin domain-containing protein n=1 Tax=Athelia psychrophila TaxID=1759441 RepID=A0A166T7E8_9AGAM|nr:hypothetical protein FIBSPDRAFT_850571 [Fibularhizoctonia sp. CBS 109695]
MPKPTIEFTPTSSFELVVPAGPLARTEASYRVLAEDLSTGDKTVILIHPPSQEWGGDAGKDSQAVHVYWEEVLILRGRIFDKGLQQWFSANQYCCRPPGMLHGPWIADPDEGCEEMAIIRHV